MVGTTVTLGATSLEEYQSSDEYHSEDDQYSVSEKVTYVSEAVGVKVVSTEVLGTAVVQTGALGEVVQTGTLDAVVDQVSTLPAGVGMSTSSVVVCVVAAVLDTVGTWVKGTVEVYTGTQVGIVVVAVTVRWNADGHSVT